MFCTGSAGPASRKRKRASSSIANSTSLPLPISIPPTQSFNGNDGMWSSFPMRIGRPAQDVLLLPSTASSETWVIQSDTGCPDGVPVPPSIGTPNCYDSRGRLFDSNQSATWIANSIYTLGVEGNLGMDSAANFGYDTIVIGTAGSDGPTADHQVVANSADPKYWTGQLGLNPASSNFTNFVSPQPSLMDTLKQTNQIPSVSYAYTAGAYYRGDHILGSLTLGGWDANLVGGQNVTVAQSDNENRDLVASIQNIKTNTTTASLLPSGSIYSFIDSTIPYIYLPIDACQAFETAFGLSWDPTWELYLINNTQHQSLLQSSPSVTFTVGTQQDGGETVDLQFPYAAFDMNISYPFINSTIPPYLNTERYFPLKRAANDTQYTLGRTFLQEAYLIADYEHNNFTVVQRNWSANGQHDLHTIYPAGYEFPSAKEGSSISGGAIAGIVVGTMTLFAVLAGLFALVRRQNQTKKRTAAAQGGRTGSHLSDDFYNVDHKSGVVTPYTRHTSQLLSESDSSQRFEMPAPNKAGLATGKHRNDSQEVMGSEPARELNAGSTSGTTWEADSSIRFELAGSDAPLGMSEKLGGARLSTRHGDDATR